MEILLRETVSYWPAILAHYPAALLCAAAVASVIWMVQGGAVWRRIILFLSLLSLAGTSIVILLGSLEQAPPGSLPSLQILHRQLTLFGLLGESLTLFVMAGLTFWLNRRLTYERDPPDPAPARVVAGLLVLATAALIFLAARAGSMLVQ